MFKNPNTRIAKISYIYKLKIRQLMSYILILKKGHSSIDPVIFAEVPPRYI